MMTLEEFAKTKLSIRAKNVVMSISEEGIWFTKDKISFRMKPMRDANIFDVFKHLSKESLARQVPNCGGVTAEEIAMALEEEGFLNWKDAHEKV
jgi:predicted transcriptional regulator YheO